MPPTSWIKKVVVHEVAVALVVGDGKAPVLVQVHRGDLGEVHLALLVPLDQVLVRADGAGTGGQAQHTVGLEDHLGGQDIGRLPAHGGVVRRFVNTHTDPS